MASVLVPLAQGCEELEAVTIVDILRRAGIEVVTAGLDDQPVTASRGVRLLPDTTLDQIEHRQFNMVALPGGLPGADHLAADPRIRRHLQATAQAGGYTAAICAAPRVLAEAGLLTGKTATAYPGVLERLALPDTRLSAAAVVRDGTVVTSRGPGTAMDFTLALVEVLAGRAKRDEVEAGLVRER